MLLLPVALFQITRRLDLGLMDTGLILVVKAGVLLFVYFVYKSWAFTSNDEIKTLKGKHEKDLIIITIIVLGVIVYSFGVKADRDHLISTGKEC